MTGLTTLTAQPGSASVLRFTKGHGTENDFVLVDDRAAQLGLTPALVRALTDRRAGVGGDGVIRLVPSASLPEGAAILATEPAATWFMDYRNADGSVAQMCGNGVRVLAAFLERLGLAVIPEGDADGDQPAAPVRRTLGS